jgi:type VI secretion system protein ImpC
MAKTFMQFDFSLNKPRSARRVDEDDVFRILLLADLGSHTAARVPLAQRKPLRVDIDNFDAGFARVAPRLELTLDGVAVDLEFHEMDDFHPDQLFARMASFVALRELRAKLADPAQFRAAAAALTAAPATSGPAAAPTDADEGSDMERLLGRKPVARPIAVASTADLSIDGWLRGVVAPHVVQDSAVEQAHLIAAVDSAITIEMRRVLHHPAFQALEANWRGIERLVRELDLGETLELLLLDVRRDELAQDFSAHADNLSRSALHRHLCGPHTEPPDGQPWSLLASDLSFGADLAELQLLAAMGAMAGRAGAPLLAAARPSLIGCPGMAQLVDVKAWRPVDADVATFWSALRQSPLAAWIGLALPRILVRLPYGKASDPISAFAFEEMASQEHESYLWGSPAFSLALLAGQAFMEAGWQMALTSQDITDLPSHIYRDDGESRQQACAEVTLSESAGEAVLRHGTMALLSYRNRNAVRLLRWQSIADPARALQAAWA